MIKGAVGEQLPMFMTAHEIQSYARPTDLSGGWEQAYREAQEIKSRGGVSLAEHVAKHGVEDPVHIVHHGGGAQPELADGHHRVALEAQNHPQRYLPMEHWTPKAWEEYIN